jgi:CHASE2 domain-containing sensor protein
VGTWGWVVDLVVIVALGGVGLVMLREGRKNYLAGSRPTRKPEPWTVLDVVVGVLVGIVLIALVLSNPSPIIGRGIALVSSLYLLLRYRHSKRA